MGEFNANEYLQHSIQSGGTTDYPLLFHLN
jgi:hypothetical protein